MTVFAVSYGVTDAHTVKFFLRVDDALGKSSTNRYYQNAAHSCAQTCVPSTPLEV